MTVRSTSLALTLLFVAAGCDGEAEILDQEFRGHGHGNGNGHGHGHGHGHHGNGHGHGHDNHGHDDHARAQAHNNCGVLDIRDLLAEYDEDTNPYANPHMWLSGPDSIDDFVLSVNLATTIVHPDLSTEVVHPVRPVDPELDIFYIHPTVNLSPEAGNDDLSDLTNTKSFVKESVARFSTLGRVIAPLYHSSKAGCFFAGPGMLAECLEIAYQDVEDAFAYYLDNHWEGQKLVIMGWSQGAIMTRMLMQQFVAGHPDLMSRVAVVMPMSGDLNVDSFDAIPACQEEQETGCYITYHAFMDGAGPEANSLIGGWADGNAACTDVAGAAAIDGLLTSSFFSLPTAPGLLPTDALAQLPVAIETPFMAFPQFYAAGCIDQGGRYLEVLQADPTDQRWAPINYNHPFVQPDPPFGLGIHIFDWSVGMGDLLYLVEAKTAELAGNEQFHVIK